MRTSTQIKRANRSPRLGFSLMEILVVLVIMALSTALIMPSTARMLDQATSHAVFFEFQRDVSELRRSANRSGIGLRLVDPAKYTPDTEGEVMVTLRAPWRYTLAPDLEIQEGGVCSATTANLINGDRVVMTLHSSTSDCRFIRLQSAAAQTEP